MARTSPRTNSNRYSNAVKYGRGGGNQNFSNRQQSGQPNGGSKSSNSGGSQGSNDTGNNDRNRDREQASSSHQPSGQPQGGSMSSNSGGFQGSSDTIGNNPRPSTSGGSQGNIDTGNKPDENVSYTILLFTIFSSIASTKFWTANGGAEKLPKFHENPIPQSLEWQ